MYVGMMKMKTQEKVPIRFSVVRFQLVAKSLKFFYRAPKVMFDISFIFSGGFKYAKNLR